MIYQEQPDRLDSFGYHEWVDTPARMLGAALADYLAGSGLYQAVLSSSGDIATDQRLDAELIRLVQIFQHDRSHVELRFRVHLIRHTSHEVLLTRSFTYEEPAAAATPEAGVAAANRAVQRLLKDVLALLNEAAATHPCASAPPSAGGLAPERV